MCARWAAGISGVDQKVIVEDESLKIDLLWRDSLQDEERSYPGFERRVERARTSFVFFAHFFTQCTTPSLASWWQIPTRSLGSISDVRIFDVIATVIAFSVVSISFAYPSS